MASATGIPERNPTLDEDEPLLGRPGDATQRPDQGLHWNFVLGTGEYSHVHRNDPATYLLCPGRPTDLYQLC